jgi:hypothetical protein
MIWHDFDICFTVVTAIVGGMVAGWFAHGSARRGVFGFLAAVVLSASLMFVPQALATFRLWLYLPQEISLTQELLLDGIVAFPLASILAGIAWLFGFAQYKRCTE